MSFLPLYVIVFISGASVLALEILGTRILGPFYGVSLFLWSALITVTLAALSLGYLLGGRWADRKPRYGRLGWVLLLAGIWIMTIPWIRHPLLALLEPAGLRTAVLAASAVLFFPPLTLLGMTSPYAIRLRTARVEEVGRSAGDVYAVSTLASVFAALLTGFYLIPNFGVFRLTLLVGAVLILGAMVAFGAGKSLPTAGLALVFAIAGGVAAFTVPGETAQPEEGLLSVRQSPYAEIRVFDWDNTRALMIDGGGHSVVEPGNWRSMYPYVVVMDIDKFLFEEPGDLLVLGLGGGSVVKSFAKSGWTVDAVEIDPVIVRTARKYFGLDSKDATVFTMDARRYLRTHDKRYDIIILDAFGSSAIPFHLVTTEAFAEVADHLKPDGVFSINFETVGWHHPLTAALTATLQEHFSNVVALPMAEPPNKLGNMVMTAANRPLEFPEGMLGRPYDFLGDNYLHWAVVERNHAWDNRFTEDTANVPVLTDDLNPVDLWSDAINLVARKNLHADKDWNPFSW